MSEQSVEWHLSNILGYISTRPGEDLAGVPDDDAAKMRVVIRVGDIRAAYAALIKARGTKGAEAKWVADGVTECPHCGGSGHRGDIA